MHVAELNRMGAKILIKGNKAIIEGNINFAPAELMATDLRASVSLILAALTAKGKSVINRIYHLDRGYEDIEKKLRKVGAKISTNGNKAIIEGNINFAPAELMATDLRASVSLILAALTAKGKSVINRIYHLDRGYENIEKKLKKVGAKIRRVN